MNTSSIRGARALLAAALDAGPSLPASTLTGSALLLIDLGRPAPLTADEAAALTRWLERQAAPVIGITPEGACHPLACACDALVPSLAEAHELSGNIEAAPLAAMVLVQLLRISEQLPIEQALLCESLAYATLQSGGEFRRWLESAARPARAAPETGAAVLLERRGANLSVRLNRPARRNALSVEMRDALVEALELVIADDSIEAVTVSGVGKCFSAGGDLSEFGSAADAPLAHAVRSVRCVPALLARCARRLRFRVHGAAIGAGVEMAAFAGHIEATADAFFQLPEIRYGLIPGCGGCVSIPRRIGRLRTAYLALSAQPLPAQQALEWGLIDAVSSAPVAALED